ncbi:NACHT, LRR and PYD domains-containing protein 6 isoform X3 [Larus michahellis]|uniref:NACHT, LRR and PYD domains-containing protein 6 isoform X3 n=1 Tax=Larus michahellis TaxID=119627 RepID=UPI003D9BCD6F
MGQYVSKKRTPSRGIPPGTAGDLLLHALEDLTQIDFKKFRDALAHGDLQGRRCIPRGRLEKADWMDTKNLMLDFYGGEAALDVAIAVFERIHLRNAADLLRESRERALGPAALLGSSSPDFQRNYKRAIRQAYSRIKDQNARVGDNVSLNARYSRLVIVNKHRDEEEREHEIVAMGRRHAEIIKEQASASIVVGDLFKPGPDGWTPKEVVLLGAAGVGKTMTARKIMLDWASDKVFVEFDYVFYIHCREGNLLTSQASMADLITQCYPGSSPPLAEMLGQMERLLFIIDGFDELRFSVDRPLSELCSQPFEQRPVEIILSSLFRRRLLPKSSLLVTTRPAALRKLGKCLECERYAEILGFDEAEREEYFHKFFENAEQAAAAFQFVRGNEMLFTMCLVPIVCWIVCTVMKQQLGCAGGLTQSPKTTTGIYILYLLALLRSLSGPVKQGMPAVLRRLCCLAADGVWRQKVLFEEKEVQGYALDQREALPLLLNEHLFQKDISCVSTYSFIHLSFQEFFAALFYLLEDEGEARDPPAGPTREVKALLESYGNSRNYFMMTVRFLFGLLNKDRRRELEEEMDCKISPRITQELLVWLQKSQQTALALLEEETAVIREMEVCHCLYELQDEHFVVTALDPFMGVYLRGINLNRFDQIVLAFSIKHFPKLESLDLGHCSFLRDHPEHPAGPQPAQPARREIQQEEGKQSPIHLLCQALEKSGCKLKTLRFDRCQLTGACCGALASVLSVKPTLAELDLAGNEDLRDGGVKLLCEGLACGGCRLQILRLGCCNLTAVGCGALAAALGSLPALAQLDLSDNPLGDGGVRELCTALAGPGCSLQKLWLWRCRLTAASCGALAAVLLASPSLTELHLGDNELGDGGVRRLSEGLRDPACRLQTLSLWQSRLTGACCADLCAMLSPSRSLEFLDLSDNDLGDASVQQLCKALGHPTCCLQKLWLKKSGLSTETLQKLDALKCGKPTLNIGYM